MAKIEPKERTIDGRIDQVVDLYKQVTDWPGFCDGQSVVATSGPLLTLLRTERPDGR